MYIAILILTAAIFWVMGGITGMTIVEEQHERAAKTNRCISLDGIAYRLTEVDSKCKVGE